MGLTRMRCTAIATAGMFIALSGAMAQQGANGNMSGDMKMGSGKMGSGKMGMKTSAADTKFAMDAAIGGMTEVELGKMAASKGQSDKVKQFGQRMADDHSKANEELKAAAMKNNMTLPMDMDAKHKAMVAKYSNMSGAAFDKAYIADMVKDHEKDVAAFQKESMSGSNEDLKGFASKTLPTLQDHLRMVQEIHSGMMMKKM